MQRGHTLSAAATQGDHAAAAATDAHARGERFVNEIESPSDSVTPVPAQQPDQLAYVLLDAKLAEK